MKFLYDLFPVILFFVSYYKADLILDNTPAGHWIDPTQPAHIAATILATSIAIIASFVQVSGFWLKHRRFEKMHIFSLVMISVLGGLTIYIGDPAFIQWKPTVLNWAFAVAFLSSQFIGKKNLVERMMAHQISLPESVWTRLNISWIAFFILSGVANLYVAFYYATDLDAKTRMDNWVNFKLYGLMGMTLVFMVLQAIYLSRHIQEPAEAVVESQD